MRRWSALGIVLAGCSGGGEAFTLYVLDAPEACPTYEECPLAVGGTERIDVRVHVDDVEQTDDRFVAVIDDPSVVAAERVPDGLVLTGLAEGDATLRLEHEVDPISLEVPVHVAAIARTVIVPEDVRYGIATTEPLLVLHDSRVVLEARHFDAANRPLAGTGIDAWALSGATGATLVGDAGATTHELGTHDVESFTVTSGGGELAVTVVGPDAVRSVELVATGGRSRVARAGEVLRVSGRYPVTLQAAGYDATGAYIAGGGLPDDFTASGAGVRRLDRVLRQLTIEAIETDLEVQIGATVGTFGVVFR